MRMARGQREDAVQLCKPHGPLLDSGAGRLAASPLRPQERGPDGAAFACPGPGLGRPDARQADTWDSPVSDVRVPAAAMAAAGADITTLTWRVHSSTGSEIAPRVSSTLHPLQRRYPVLPFSAFEIEGHHRRFVRRNRHFASRAEITNRRRAQMRASRRQ